MKKPSIFQALKREFGEEISALQKYEKKLHPTLQNKSKILIIVKIN